MVDTVSPTPPSLLLIYVEAPPVAANSSGIKGQFSYDGTYFYLCIATDTWLRTEMFTW